MPWGWLAKTSGLFERMTIALERLSKAVEFLAKTKGYDPTGQRR